MFSWLRDLKCELGYCLKLLYKARYCNQLKYRKQHIKPSVLFFLNCLLSTYFIELVYPSFHRRWATVQRLCHKSWSGETFTFLHKSIYSYNIFEKCYLGYGQLMSAQRPTTPNGNHSGGKQCFLFLFLNQSRQHYMYVFIFIF